MRAYAEAARSFAGAGVIQKERSKVIDRLLLAYPNPTDQPHLIGETSLASLENTADEVYADVLAMGAI